MKREYKDDKTITKYLLSKGYQTCEWIESNRTQYLKTNIYPAFGDTYIIDVIFYSGNIQYFSGCWSNVAQGGWYILMTYINGAVIAFQFNGQNLEIPTGETGMNSRHKYEVTTYKSGAEGKYDNIPLIKTSTFSSTLPNRPIYIFCSNDKADGTYAKTKARLYSYEIVGKLKLYPVYNVSTGAGAMWDSVSDTILTNQGSGTFTHGADIEI